MAIPNLIKSIASVIVLLVVQSCSTPSQITDHNNQEKYFYIIAQDRSGLLGEILNKCAGLHPIRTDVVNLVDGDMIFLDLPATTDRVPNILMIVFRVENDNDLNIIKLKIGRIPEVKSVNIY